MKLFILYIMLSLLIRASETRFRDRNNTSELKNRSTSDETVSMIFVGDISFDGPVKYFAEVEKTCDYRRPFSKVKKFLAQADLRIGNLESPLLKKPYGEKAAADGKIIYHGGAADAVDGLTYAGFDVLQLANNHINDFGATGVKSTESVLKKAGISYVGLRKRKINKRTQVPAIKTVKGIKIGFLAYCLNIEGCDVYMCNDGLCNDSANVSDVFNTGAVSFDKRLARYDIKALAKKVDIVVVLMHWSRELSLIPPLGVRQIAYSLKVFGANLIIGGHPHVIQGHECLGAGAISVYSLGNFLFPKSGLENLGSLLGGDMPSKENVKTVIDGMKNVYSQTQFSYMFKIKVSKKGIVAAEYLPLEIRNDARNNCLQPTPVTNRWVKFCDITDLHCIDFRDVCASESSLPEQLVASKKKNDACILD